MEFVIPAQPEDLLDEDKAPGARAVVPKDLAELPKEDVSEFAEGALYEICNHDALSIVEQDVFDQVYSLIRGFTHLDSVTRHRLVDGLCSNLSVLCLSASALSGAGDPGDDGSEREATAASHRSALHAYVFFLSWLCSLAEAEARAAAPAAPSGGAGGKPRGRKRGAPHEMLSWDWEGQREKLARALALVAGADLHALYRPRPPDDRLLQAWSRTAHQLAESASAMRSKPARMAAFEVLAAVALKYGALEAVTGALTAALARAEHLASALAELAAFAENKFGDSRLAVELLREVASVDPAVYERQQKEDAAGTGGVRNVAAFVAELAEQVPRTVAAHISLLAPHLGGRAYSLRSAIVTAIGHLIVRAFPSAPGDDADAQGMRARQLSKQRLLDTLVERALDANAFTRARVMQTWAHLVSANALPLGHYLCVTRLAIGRLEDKSSLVRKAALQLLGELLASNPFGPRLPEADFAASLAEYKARLQEKDPQPDEKPPGDAAQWPEGRGPSPDPGPGGREHAPGDDGGGGVADPDAPAGDSMEAMDMELVAMRAGSQQVAPTTGAGLDKTVAQARTMVASLDAALAFTRAVSGALPLLTQLLASAAQSDVAEAITLLLAAARFGIEGAPAALRRMLPLVFSREQAVRDAVVDALDELHLAGKQPQEAMLSLISLTYGATLGEMSALEEVVAQLLVRQPAPLLRPLHLQALWNSHAGPEADPNPNLTDTPASAAEDPLRELRGGLELLAMVAAKRPEIIGERLPLLLKVGFCQRHRDAAATHAAAAALRHLGAANDPPPPADLQPALRALAGSGWYAVAEEAVAALYALHPHPARLAGAVLERLAAAALKGAGAGSQDGSGPAADGVPSGALAHFFFVLGQVALQQLVHGERMARAVRLQRAAAEKAAAEARCERLAAGGASSQGGAEDDIATQLGVGAAAADAELDALKETAEAEILAPSGLIGRIAPLVAAFCHNRALLGAHVALRGAALLALARLMCTSAQFCDDNLRLLVTLLHTRAVEPGVRCNLVVALGDLAFRFPNLVEPWTAHLYQPLSDPAPGVRKTSLMVLTHLILNDMMKVKGHVAALALRLRDDEPRIAALAALFFHELASKAYKGTNPIYNLLPDMLSSLAAEPSLAPADFQSIMRTLLGYIGKDRHADALVDKLLARFEGVSRAPLWRNLAFCLLQLAYSEKGYRKMAEMLKTYRHALADEEVLAVFKALAGKARKLAKQSQELKADMDAFEERLAAQAAEVLEEQAAAAAAAALAGRNPEPDPNPTAAAADGVECGEGG
ncbi:hypothetical protein WJX81_003584 [Elliptochloris bilobata]|uniref:Condensin-1 complex subunit CAP-D2 n=1 Tax=Elliptochloris bilobata TaxID=381761 RepID=A0AAW1S087_9CHLO